MFFGRSPFDLRVKFGLLTIVVFCQVCIKNVLDFCGVVW